MWDKVVRDQMRQKPRKRQMIGKKESCWTHKNKKVKPVPPLQVIIYQSNS